MHGSRGGNMHPPLKKELLLQNWCFGNALAILIIVDKHQFHFMQINFLPPQTKVPVVGVYL